MAFHHFIQRLLLTGTRLPASSPPDAAPQPAALAPLIQAISPAHGEFNRRAVMYGNRYRSAFWAIYLLIALAVLCAGLPLALGWDNAEHALHHFSIAWVITEVILIFSVGLIYWRGHRDDWQGQWLAARTRAELTWYLPLIAPLVDFSNQSRAINWYGCLQNSGHGLQADAAVDDVCVSSSALASAQLDGVWSDPQFVVDYARWTASILEGQRQYHHHVALRQHALQHRVHTMTAWLFGMTGLSALAHLVVHSNVLTLATMFLPALGASLHGALAQSEAYRLEAASERLALELARLIEPLQATTLVSDPLALAEELGATVLSAVLLILDEHKDWHMLVRPHHLPLG